MPLTPQIKALIDSTLDEDHKLAAEYLQKASEYSKVLAEMDPVDETSADAAAVTLRRRGFNTRWTGRTLVLDPGESRAAFPAVAATIRSRTTDPDTLKYLDEAKSKIAARIDQDTNYHIGSESLARRQTVDREALQYFWDTESETAQRVQGLQEDAQQRAQYQAEKRVKGVEEAVGTGAVRDVAVGAMEGAGDVGALMHRAFELGANVIPTGIDLGKDGIRVRRSDQFVGTADELNREASALEQAAQAGDEAAGRHESLGRWLRSAGRSAVPLVVGGAAGRLIKAGALGLSLKTTRLLAATSVGGAVAANNAFTEGSDAGLEGAKLYGYLATVGAAETVLSTVLSKALGKVLGSEGIERLFLPGAAGSAFSKGALGAAKTLGLDLLSEVTEENLVEISQAVAAKAFGVDPTSWTSQQFWSLVADTTMSTLLLTGGAHGASAGLGLAMRRGTDSQRAGTNAALAQELNYSPEREGKIADLAARMGVSPELLRALPDNQLDTSFKDASALASQVPGLQRFLAADPANVTVAKGDHQTLAQIAQLAETPSHRQEGVKGDPTAEAVSFMQDQLAINQLVQESQTAQRSKAKMAEALEAMGAARDVSVDATVAMELMQDGNLQEGLNAVGITADEVQAAAKDGRDIKTNTGRLHTTLTPEQFKAVAKVLKRTESAASVAELEGLDRAAETGRVRDTLAEYQAREETARKELDRIATELQGLTVQGKPMDAQAVQDTLRIADAYDRRMAANGGERGAYLRKTSFTNATAMPASNRPAEEMDQEPVETDPAAAPMADEIDVDGKARSTLNSNGKRIAQTEEAVRNFWRWFGDSKVVDEQGRPLVVYRGRGDTETTLYGSRRDGLALGPGVYFTTSQERAQGYADTATGRGLPGNVVAVYLAVENPRVVEDYGNTADDIKAEANTDDYGQALSDLGIDGIRLDNTNDGDVEFVVFSPTQIKSATGNRGTFDANDPSILNQGGDLSKIADSLLGIDGAEEISVDGKGVNTGTVLFQLREAPKWAEKFLSDPRLAKVFSKKDIEKFGKDMLRTAAVYAHLGVTPDEVAKNPLRSNMDPKFTLTFDLSTICPQQDQYVAAIRALEEAYNGIFPPIVRARVGELMKNVGEATSCFYCYGQSGRDLFDWSIVRGVQVINKAIVAAKDGPLSEQQILDIFASAGGKLYTTGVLRQMVDKYTDGSIEPLDPLRIRDLIEGLGANGTEAQKALVEKAPVEEIEIAKAVQTFAQGASGRNAPKGFASYVDSILRLGDEYVEFFNQVGGMRFNSQTDFRAWHVVDMAQAFVHMAQRKLGGHVYCKEPWFVRIFGKTGMKFNMSMEAVTNKDGTVEWNYMEGFPPDEALKVRKANKNAGTMLMVADDKQFTWGLNNPEVDMMIPFHAGRLSKEVVAMKGAKDYSNWQSEDWSGHTEKMDKKAVKKIKDGYSVKLKDGSTVEVKLPPNKRGKPISDKDHPLILQNAHLNKAARYKEICAKLGVKPVFSGLTLEDGTVVTEHKNYMKVVRDVATQEVKQTPVDPTKIDWKAAEAFLNEWVKKGGDQTKARPGLVEYLRLELNKLNVLEKQIPAIELNQPHRKQDLSGQAVPIRPGQTPQEAAAEERARREKQQNVDPNAPTERIVRKPKVDPETELPLNPDGTVTVYHHTSKEAAAEIERTGKLVSKGEPHVYVTSRKEADTGYGDTAVAIRVPPALLALDDAFPDGRKDFRISVGKPGGSVAVQVGDGLELNQPAYHGTGNSLPYDRFDYNRVGGPGGEGAQAYGWGLYFAGKKEVAEFYKNTLASGQRYKGDPAFLAAARSFKDSGVGRDEALAGMRAAYPPPNDPKWGAYGYETHDLQLQAALRSAYEGEGGKLYTVEIPEDSELLDWDKTVPEDLLDLLREKLPEAAARALPARSVEAVENNGKWDVFAKWRAGESVKVKTADSEAFRDRIASALMRRLTGEETYRVIAGALGGQKAASDALRAAGIPGIRYLDGGSRTAGDGTHNYVIFNDSRVQIQGYEQPGAELPRAAVNVTDKGYLIKVFQDADMSSIVHELSHSFLFEFQGLVSSGRASRAAVKDWQTLMRWLEVKDGAITREQHEKFARGWEKYMLEGKAPATGLMGAFQRFSHWMKEVYKDAKQYFQGVKLNDDVRRVFDRMLANEEDAARAVFASEQTVRSDKELKELDLSPEEKDHVNNLLEAGRAKLEDQLTRARNRELLPLLAKWRKEAKAEADKLPVYAALAAAAEAGGLRWSRLKFDFGQDTINRLREIHGDNVIAKKEDTGAQPEDLADIHGFESVEDMLVQMMDAPRRSVWEKAAVDQKLQDHDFRFDPMEMVADSEEFAEAAEMMAQYYGRALQTGEQVVTTKAIKERAKQMIGDMPMGEAVRQDKFINQVRTHTQRERRAAAKGDFKTALQSNEKARLALQLAAEATRIQELRDATIKKAKAAVDAPPKGQPLKVAAAHMENIAALMIRYGLGLKKAKINSKKELLVNLFRDVDGVHDMTGQFDPRFFNEADAVRYQQLSVAEFESLSAIISALDRTGRDIATDFINEGKARLAEVVGGSVAYMGKLKDKSRWFDGNSTLGKIAERLNETLIGPLTQMDFILRAADGFNGPRVKDLDPNRPLTKNVVLRSSEAAHKAEVEFKRMHELLRPHLGVLAKAMGRIGRKPKNAPPMPEFVAKGLNVKNWTNDQLLGMALNMGNAYNRQGLARGFGWDAADEALMPPVLSQVGRLFTAQEWQAVQGIWDAIGTMKEALFDAHEKMFGFRPVEVEATPFTVTTADDQTINLPGGYFPVRFDQRLSLRQAGQEEAQSIKDMFGAAFAPVAAKRGMTIARKNTGGKPFLLDPARVLRDHVEFTTRFITHGQFVRDTNRLFTNKDWAETFVDKFGRHVYDELNGWLRSQVVSEYQKMSAFDNLVEKSRPLTSLYVLGLRAKSAISQIDALASLPADIGIGNYLKGVARMANPKQLVTDWKFMLENSTFMRERLTGGRDREMNDLLRGSLDLAAFATMHKIKKAGQHVSLAPIIYPSLAMEFPAWTAMYHKALAEHGDPALAVTLADNAVASTQPANRAKDLSRMQRDKKGAARLVTMFMSFSIRRWNANNFMRRAMVEGRVSAADAVTYGFLTWVVAPVLPTLALALLWNDWDDDEAWEKLGVKSAQELLAYQIQGIPLAKDALGATVKLAEGKNLQGSVSTAADTPARLIARAAVGLVNLPEALNGDDTEPFWALADLASYASGVPVVRAYKDLTKGWEQYEDEGNPVNILIPQPKEKK